MRGERQTVWKTRWKRSWKRSTLALATQVVAALLVAALLGALAGCGGAQGDGRAKAPAAQRNGAAGASASAAEANRPVYVAIGASDAFGIGTDDPKTQAWPVVVANGLKPPVHLVNLGIPGATVAQALRDELPITLAAKPQIITIWLAVNDYDANVPLETYRAQLDQLLSTLASATQARVYVGNMPDLSYVPYFARRDQQTLRSQIAAWNTVIAEVCRAHGATLVNLYASWAELEQNPAYVSGDGFHPSTLGAKQLARLFADDITLTPPESATTP